MGPRVNRLLTAELGRWRSRPRSLCLASGVCPKGDHLRDLLLERSLPSDRQRAIKNGNDRTARFRGRPALLPTRRLLHRRVQSDLRKARSPHRVPTRRPPDSRGQSNARLTAASDFTEMIDVIRPRISRSRAPSAVCACSSACASRATPGRARATSGRAQKSQHGIMQHRDGLKKRRAAA